MQARRCPGVAELAALLALLLHTSFVVLVMYLHNGEVNDGKAKICYEV